MSSNVEPIPANGYVARPPRVSVVLTTYNHEQFIVEAVESVLCQTLDDLELIVIDDGSRDATRALLARFDDSRLRLVFQENGGPSRAANAGIGLARGEYVALMSGDDVCHPKRLAEQYRFAIAAGADFVFCLPQLIDDASALLDDAVFPAFVARSAPKSADFFRVLFEHGNFLCAPTAFMRHDALHAVGAFHEGLIQLQDYELWGRAAARFQFAVMGERLFQYRIRAAEANLSSRSNDGRTHFEFMLVMRSFLDACPVRALQQHFPGMLKLDAEDGDTAAEIGKSFILLSHTLAEVRAVGAERMTRLLNEPVAAARLEAEYNFTPRDLFQITAQLDMQNRNDIRRLQAALNLRIRSRSAVA